MRQEIIVAKPPVYDRCVKAFGAENIVDKPILWSWGDKIYNPLNVDIPRELLAHEAIHGVRQRGIVESWWDMYLREPGFRYEEELLAHRAEWKNWLKWHPGKDNTARLEHIAGRLSSAMYGSIVTLDHARAAVL